MDKHGSVQWFESGEPFTLQSGDQLPGIRLAYHVYGRPELPVMWVFHALTGSSRIEEWWSQALGNKLPLDPDRWRIVCVNMPGSCYGSSGPTAVLPGELAPRYQRFPALSIRDQVHAFDLLRRQLGIAEIAVGIGSSMGGQQLLEWASWQPDLFRQLVVIASNAVHSAWGRAFNAAQRMAIESDVSFGEANKQGGLSGMGLARAIAMLSYRSYADLEYKAGQAGEGRNEESYLRHVGQRLMERFSPSAYHLLTRAMDSHACGAADGLTPEEALQRIQARSLVVSIDSDLLFPPQEQIFIARNIPNARLQQLHSPYGHDAFLIEFPTLNSILQSFLT